MSITVYIRVNRRDTLKYAETGEKNSGNPINKKDQMDFFHIAQYMYSNNIKIKYLVIVTG
jgi:hypothetical protein